MRNLAVFGLLIMAMFTMAIPAEARLRPPGIQWDRLAVIDEANFAVTGQPYYYPSGQLLGQWNYMGYDIVAQQTIINRLGSYNAGWTTPIVSGLVPNGYVNGMGRGGQCLFEINLLLYRSGSDTRDVHKSWAHIESYSAQIDNPRPLYAGDIVFKPRPNQHIAMVVSRSGDNVQLVESNYLGGTNAEVLSIRPTTVTWLKNNGYKVYTDIQYYYN